MAKDEKLLELEEELKTVNWDIRLSEVKRRGKHSIDLKSGNILYYRGPDKETYGRIGFLVKKKLKAQIQTFKSISDRVGLLL